VTPYRAQRDGHHPVNTRSPAVSLNRTRRKRQRLRERRRLGRGRPDWQTTGHDGKARLARPPIHVQDAADFPARCSWSVPVTVDDVAVTIDGRRRGVDAHPCPPTSAWP
jgi:hypothetical protein